MRLQWTMTELQVQQREGHTFILGTSNFDSPFQVKRIGWSGITPVSALITDGVSGLVSIDDDLCASGMAVDMTAVPGQQVAVCGLQLAADGKQPDETAVLWAEVVALPFKVSAQGVGFEQLQPEAGQFYNLQPDGSITNEADKSLFWVELQTHLASNAYLDSVHFDMAGGDVVEVWVSGRGSVWQPLTPVHGKVNVNDVGVGSLRVYCQGTDNEPPVLEGVYLNWAAVGPNLNQSAENVVFVQREAAHGPSRESLIPNWFIQDDQVPVLFLSACSWESSGGGQRPVALAREFAMVGHPVIYYSDDNKEFRIEDEAVCIIHNGGCQTILPHLKQYKGIVVVGLPTFINEARELAAAGWTVVYDLIDDWDGFVAGGDLNEMALWAERDLISLCGLVTCSAPSLVERATRLGARKTVLIRNGGPNRLLLQKPMPWDMLDGPIKVVFCGHLEGNSPINLDGHEDKTSNSWVDWRAFEAIGQQDDMVLTIVGKHGNPPDLGPNVKFVGQKPYEEAMQYVANADVAIIPFRGDLCAAVDPVKLYDHWAARLWSIVTPDLTDCVDRPWVVQSCIEDFPMAIRDAVKRSVVDDDRPTWEWVRENSWAGRANTMLSAILSWRDKCCIGQWPLKFIDGIMTGNSNRINLKVTIEAPASCNASPHCHYCNNWRNRCQLPPLSRPSEEWSMAIRRLASKYGPLYVNFCYGEPFSQNSIIDLIAELTWGNIVEVASNLVVPPKVLAKVAVPERLYIAGSFHPHLWGGAAPEQFIERMKTLQDMGFNCRRAMVVAFPRDLHNVETWLRKFDQNGLDLVVNPYQGTYKGQEYPNAYTDRQWEIIRCANAGVLEHDPKLATQSPHGLFCRTGVDYIFVRWDGTIRRCYMDKAATMGNIFWDHDFELYDGAKRCMDRSCPCPDLWSYIQRPTAD